jgi:hypothetical protein
MCSLSARTLGSIRSRELSCSVCISFSGCSRIIEAPAQCSAMQCSAVSQFTVCCLFLGLCSGVDHHRRQPLFATASTQVLSRCIPAAREYRFGTAGLAIALWVVLISAPLDSCAPLHSLGRPVGPATRRARALVHVGSGDHPACQVQPRRGERASFSAFGNGGPPAQLSLFASCEAFCHRAVNMLFPRCQESSHRTHCIRSLLILSEPACLPACLPACSQR